MARAPGRRHAIQRKLCTICSLGGTAGSNPIVTLPIPHSDLEGGSISWLELKGGAATPDTYLTTTQAPGIGVQFPTEAGVNYHVAESEDLEEFFPPGVPFIGNGENAAIGDG